MTIQMCEMTCILNFSPAGIEKGSHPVIVQSFRFDPFAEQVELTYILWTD